MTECERLLPWLEGITGEFLPPLIESDDKVIRVVAGPGSGKTAGLKRRVQRLVEGEGVDASKDIRGHATRWRRATSSGRSAWACQRSVRALDAGWRAGLLAERRSARCVGVAHEAPFSSSAQEEES